MLVRGAMIVWAVAATVLPLAAAYAADAAPNAAVTAMESTPPDASPAPEPVSTDPVESVPLDARPVGLNYKFDAPAPEPLPDGLRFDFARRPASASALRFSPAPSGPRPGWAFSGRAGPLRWLTPLDGEGGTKVRLWGRIPDQPRQPGLGNLNMSIHYSFE
jgi:hypothetical protein